MYENLRTRLVAAGAVCVLLAAASVAGAQTVNWGVNGVGGSGNWDTTTADWFDGTQNVVWPSSGSAIFAGAAGGTVSVVGPAPVVSSMTFNTPGYVVQGGNIQYAASGLTVTTNVDATFSSALGSSGPAGGTMIKNGPAKLIQSGTNFIQTVDINQGEVRLTGSSGLFFSNVVLADAPGVVVTLAQSSSTASINSLTGGGTAGGVVQPDDQPRTVTLSLLPGGNNFGGVLQDNGSGILALSFSTTTLTNVNTYSGPTTINSTLTLSKGGAVSNSASLSITSGGRLVLSNGNGVLADRVSNTAPIAMESSTIQLNGSSMTPIEEVLGQLSMSGVPSVTVSQPNTAATQLTFAGLQRIGHAAMTVSGPGIKFTGLSNDSVGIAPPFITAANDWVTVGADGRLATFTAYATDINSGSTTDNVKITTAGTTSLAAVTSRGSLNLQNASTSVAQVLDLSGQNLELTSGGVLSSGNGTSTIRNGTISTPAGEIVVRTPTNSNNRRLTIESSIVDSGGTTALTKTGQGILALTGANTYAGTTSIMEGTLIVANDANLGVGSTIDLCSGSIGGTLMAAGDFSSAKGFMTSTGRGGAVNTAGFNLTFSGPNNGKLNKTGLGTLTLTSPTVGTVSVGGGTLVLPNAAAGVVTLTSGTLQASGTLTSLLDGSLGDIPVLDIGGPTAAQLTTNRFSGSIGFPLRVNFGIGSDSIDSWNITAGGLGSFVANLGFQFEFQNLGGATTGIDYPLISFLDAPTPPPPSIFSFAPDMAAKGWSGTFSTSATGVSVRFTSVPEPSTATLLLLPAALAVWAGKRRLQRSRRARHLFKVTRPAERAA